MGERDGGVTMSFPADRPRGIIVTRQRTEWHRRAEEGEGESAGDRTLCSPLRYNEQGLMRRDRLRMRLQSANLRL